VQSYSPRLEPRKLPEREPEPEPTRPTYRPASESAPQERFWPWAAPILRVAAEAGIFTVTYAGLAVTLEGAAPLIGPIEFLLLVGLGALVGTYAQRNPEFGAVALVVAVIGGGMAAWLTNDDARALFTTGHWGAAFVTHGIGWIGAIAVLRGSFIHGTAWGAHHVERLLRGSLPVVAGLWAVATIFAPKDLWPYFLAYGLWGSLLLIVGGIAGIGLVRVAELHEGPREKDVRRLWRMVVLAAAVGVIPLSLPFVLLAGIPIDVLLQPLSGPIQFVVGILIIPFAILVDALVYLLTPLSAELGKFLDQLGRAIEQRRRTVVPVEPSLLTTGLGLLLGGFVLLVLIAAIYYLARWLIARNLDDQRPRDASGGAIEHDFVVPEPEPPRPRGAARYRRVPAHDAVTAYVNAVEDLASHPLYARAVVETPAEHSLRVRTADMPGSTDFSRLAADYQLSRYAERPITPREDRRALSRLDRLRRLLRSG
jgi:uncharacterized protein DUF4129